MKRLIIGGFPCPTKAWEKIFPPSNDQLIVPFSQIFSHYDGQFENLINNCQTVIQDYQPTSLVLHDISVLLGLISVIRLYKKTNTAPPKIILFNGAFRGFNVFKARHPFKIQWASYKEMTSMVTKSGGKVDPYFESQHHNVRKFYRQIAAGSTSALLKEALSSKPIKTIDLENEILILASQKDKYIPFNCLERINKEFAHTHMEVLKYGHFPHSLPDCKPIYERIIKFEQKKLA